MLLNISSGVKAVGTADMGTGKRNDLANAVAFMRLDERHHSLLADVAYPISFAIERMHLRVYPKKIFEASLRTDSITSDQTASWQRAGIERNN